MKLIQTRKTCWITLPAFFISQSQFFRPDLQETSRIHRRHFSTCHTHRWRQHKAAYHLVMEFYKVSETVSVLIVTLICFLHLKTVWNLAGDLESQLISWWEDLFMIFPYIAHRLLWKMVERRWSWGELKEAWLLSLEATKGSKFFKPSGVLCTLPSAFVCWL